MKTYIDLGAYDGDSVAAFMRRSDASEFTVYAFEPNPRLNIDIPGVILSRKAAWIRDEIREFAADPTETPMGSTLMSSKKHIWEISPKIEVECFDFSEWIKQFKDDYVIVKMDVEGAEFPILQKMIDDGTLEIMDELWVEWHQNKVTEFTTDDKNELVKQIANVVRLEEWH